MTKIMVVGLAVFAVACGGSQQPATTTAATTTKPEPNSKLAEPSSDKPQPPAAAPPAAPEPPATDDAALLARAYADLVSRHVLAPDPRRVAEAGFAALPGAGGKPPAFGADVAGNARVFEREARALLASQSPTGPAHAAMWPVVRAMIAEIGDAHTFLMEPAAWPALLGLLQGKAVGAPGFEVATMSDGRLVVTGVLKDSPGEKAGIKPGDILLQLGDRRFTLLSDFQLFYGDQAAGPLQVERPKSAHPLTLTYRALPWAAPVVDGRVLAGHVGYLRLHLCSFAAQDLLREQLAQLRGAGARSIVLDLRSNPGGVEFLASLFTPDDPVDVTRGRDGKEESVPRKGEPVRPVLPMVVLVDSGTYSGAEAVAFALQDHKVAFVMGTPTAGGLTDVDNIELPDGYLLHFSKGLIIGAVSHAAPAGHRVTPDKILPERTPAQLAAGVDPQLDAAAAEARKRAGK